MTDWPAKRAGWTVKKVLILIAVIWAVAFSLGFTSNLVVGVDSGELAVLIRKGGKDLAEGEIHAPTPDFKGIQLETLPEGWHLINPYRWTWVIVPQTEIPAGKVGVKLRLFGESPPPGQSLAEDGQKGVVREVLRPGRYPLNTLLYQVELRDAVAVPPGFAGVVTLLAGKEPVNPNLFVVQAGERGTQPAVEPPGTYYLNPYERRVDLIDMRSHRFDMVEKNAIEFPSLDGFPIRMEATVEWQVDPDQVAKVFVEYVTSKANVVKLEDIEKMVSECIVETVILPNARAFGRIIGSKHRAREFISGVTRQKFQDLFLAGLEGSCKRQGVLIRSALVRQTEPPKAIADPIREREIAIRQREKYEEQKLREKQQKELAKEVKLQERSTMVNKAEADVSVSVTQATREKEVALIQANRRLEVAKLELESTRNQAAAVLERGKAEADVILFQNSAEAAGLRSAVGAFGGGDGYVRYLFQQKVAPSIKYILSNTDGPFLDIFKELAAQGAPPAKPPGGGAETKPVSTPLDPLDESK